jgi:signal transduction histidine kinase
VRIRRRRSHQQLPPPTTSGATWPPAPPPRPYQPPPTQLPPPPSSVKKPVFIPNAHLVRERRGAIVGGVAQGLSAWLAIDVILVRVALVIAATSAGVGLIVYVVLWLQLPLMPGDDRAKPDIDKRSTIALGALTLGLVLLAQRLGLALPGRVMWPLIIGAAGVAMVWPRVTDLAVPDRSRLLEEGPRALGQTALNFAGSSTTTVPRVVLGSLLVLGGVSAFAIGDPSASAVRSTIIALVIMLLGSACILGPWLVRLTTDLSTERVGRARAQAREEFAAHLHDSVLQTLAIIQRRAEDPRQVVALARRQERELRAWLYDGTPTIGDVDRLSVALELTAQEVEGDHGVTIDVVNVGDIAMNDRIMSLVAAAREAMVNGAKHSGQAHLDVFAECTPDVIEVFVRDRGIGFDPENIPTHRHGVTESIRARMDRIGGRTTIRSDVGEGTEVELHLPRSIAEDDATPTTRSVAEGENRP